MSPKHVKPNFPLRRPRLFAGLLGSATITAIGLIATGPMQPPFITGTHAGVARPAAEQLQIPGKGVVAAHKVRQAPTASDALKLAISQVGVTEDASGGSKFNRWFVNSPIARQDAQRDGGSVADYANASWCDMFVSWVGQQAGVRGMGADAFTPDHAKWFIQQGRWGSTPRPGAVVFYSWNGSGVNDVDHVGLVVKDNGDGTIQTVEGNTDNAVRIRIRHTSSVVGYGYPEYAA